MTIDTFSQHNDMALNLIDLNRYPISNLNQTDGAAFLLACQQHMDANGWCSFDGFIRPEGLMALAAEANTLLPNAETLTIKRNIYQGEGDTSAPEDDAQNRQLVHHALQLANDQIPQDTLIQQLYKSDLLTDFVRRVQTKESLYRCADEFQALNIVALQPENWHAWHYDTTECTVTLLLQNSEAGGDFAFLPNSRTDESEDRCAVDSVLAGDLSKAKTLSRGAGTFTLFRGGYSLHGVTKVEGKRPRVSAIFTYDEKPEVVINDEINIRIYGERVEKILSQRRVTDTTYSN